MTAPLTPEAIERFVAASIYFHRKYVLGIEPEPPEQELPLPGLEQGVETPLPQ